MLRYLWVCCAVLALWLCAAPELTAAAPVNGVTVSLHQGWNAVGFQVQRLTELSANPAIRGFVHWTGSSYATGNFAVADLNAAGAGRKGVWILADSPTSFTYSGVDDGTGNYVDLSLNGYQLVSFPTTADIPGSRLTAVQNGQARPLSSLVILEIGPNSEYTLVDLSAGGMLRPGRAYWVLADARSGPIRLNLPGSVGRISGQVSDAAGFQVAVNGAGSTATVNPDGSFLLENVEPGPQTVTILNNFGDQAAVITVDVRPGQTSNAGLIAPRQAGLLSGIVSNEKEVLAGVSIVATPLISSAETVIGTENGRPRLFARTNARGEYTLRGLPPGAYLVTASLAGYLDSSQNVRVVARQAVSANFVLSPAAGASVRGRVTTTGGGPVRGAVVSLERLLPPTPGPSVIVVPPPGGTDPVPPIGVTPGGTFVPTPGGPETTPVSLLPGPLPEGSPGVSPPEPAPSPGEIPNPILPIRPPLVTFTDADGRYQLDAVPPGEYVLRVYRFGLAPEAQPLTLVADQVVVRDVVLVDRNGQVEGRVTIRGNGSPIEGAGVAAWPGDIYDPIPLPVPLVPIDTPTVSFPITDGGEAGGIAIHPPFRGFATTDADGRYSLKVPAGSYIVTVFAAEFADQRSPVQVTVGQTTRADFALDPAPPGGEGPIGVPLLPTLTR